MHMNISIYYMKYNHSPAFHQLSFLFLLLLPSYYFLPTTSFLLLTPISLYLFSFYKWRIQNSCRSSKQPLPQSNNKNSTSKPNQLPPCTGQTLTSKPNPFLTCTSTLKQYVSGGKTGLGQEAPSWDDVTIKQAEI
jgi:hypothetical protein